MNKEGVDEGDLAAWMSLTVEQRVIEALGHVMLNLRDLPIFACDRSVLNRGTIWFPAYLGCVDAFFVSARLAAEFFVRMPSQDFTADLFVADWSPPPAVAQRLQRVWLMTSRHIVHMGKDRVPQDPAGWRSEDLSYRALMQITRDAHRTLGKLVEAAESLGSPSAGQLRELHNGCRPQSAREASQLHGAERRKDRMAHRYVFEDPYAAVWWKR